MLGTDLNKLLSRPSVAIVGSRRVLTYGRNVTAKLAGELAAQGLIVISGLALGVDGIAHQAAIDAGGISIAVLPCGLDQVYPATHQQLALGLLEKGGALVSEYPKGMPGLKQNFVARNRLVAGLADGLIITEAAERSGSLHTARFALEQGREVMSVPDNITGPTSVDSNNLIKSGALPVTSTDDVLSALGLKPRLEGSKPVPKGASAIEQKIIDLLVGGLYDGHELQAASLLEPAEFNQTLTMLELTGKVRSLGANNWTLV